MSCQECRNFDLKVEFLDPEQGIVFGLFLLKY